MDRWVLCFTFVGLCTDLLLQPLFSSVAGASLRCHCRLSLTWMQSSGLPSAEGCKMQKWSGCR